MSVAQNAVEQNAVEVPLPGRAAVRIQTYSWWPDAPGHADASVPVPRAIVVVAHGAVEHARRYEPLARDLAAVGYAVLAFDNLGHGLSADPQRGGDGLAELGRGGNRAALRVVVAMLEHARRLANNGEPARPAAASHPAGPARPAPATHPAGPAHPAAAAHPVGPAHPATPIVLLGHSWGSLLAQRVLARHSHLLDGLVLSGTSLALPGFLNPGDLDAPWRPDASGLQWLSRDPDVRDAFAADPLCFDIAERPVWSPLQSLQLVQLPPSALTARVDDVPVLVMAGSDDTIGYGARGPRALARAYRRRTALSDVTCTIFEGARHEVYNETNRGEVVAHLRDWLNARY